MDMFMDKLAQKMTAQEIIRANTTAETEELNKLRNQVAEYNECLARLQQLIEEGAEKLKGPQVDGGELNRLVEESINKIRSLQQDNVGLGELTEQLTDRMDNMDRKMGERLISVSRSMDERFEFVDNSMEEKLGIIDRSLDDKLNGIDRMLAEKLGSLDRSLDDKLSDMDRSLDGKLSGMDRSLDDKLSDMDRSLGEKLRGVDRILSEKLEQMSGQEEEKPDIDLEEKLNTLNDNVHKECVKVYRNVQAVVVEGNEKVSSSLSDVTFPIRNMDGKVGKVFTFAAAAFVCSLISVILQILKMFGLG